MKATFEIEQSGKFHFNKEIVDVQKQVRD